jgi:dTDP-4-dehydrorhamnose reductase
MKILTLGSTGAVGTALDIVCKKRGIECVGKGHGDFEITDRAQLERVIGEVNPNAVVNCVAMVGVNPCEKEPQRAFDINGIAAANLARICEESGIIFVQPSSHAVFDGTKDDFYTEEDKVNPAGVYAVSKVAAEFFAKNLSTRHYITRFPTLFGPRRNSSKGFVDKMMDRLREGKEIKVADDKIDSPTFTIDAADAVLSMVEEEKPFGFYHIANTGKVSYFDFISRLAEKMGLEATIIHAKDGDFPAMAPKPLKTSLRSIKLDPLRTWQQALEEYVGDYL